MCEPGVHGSPPEHAVRTEAVRRWAAAHGPLAENAFGQRLAADGLTEATLSWLLAEPHDELAARLSRPGWAGYLQAVDYRHGEDPGQHDSGLRHGLRPLLAAVRAELGQPVTALIDHRQLVNRLVEQLGERLTRLAARTLVWELHRARGHGWLVGRTPEQRFADFTAQLAERGGLAAAFTQYPVLARLLGQTCQQAVAAHRELLGRFQADRAAIVETVLAGHDPGRLVDIHAVGDRHAGGRSVGVLTFDGGARVIYKPRPLELHAHFNDLVQWFNQHNPGLQLRTVALLCRPGYGWAEFIEPAPCPDLAAVQRFYHRMGALLALLYLLDGNDMHYENLVASADQPVLVDVETLFHPQLPNPETMQPDPATSMLSDSVYRTALLPLMMLGEHGALDLSGLGGGDGQLFPVDGVEWADPGTDRMRLVRRPRRIRRSRNRPRLGDQPVEPAEYEAVLLAGFRAAYEALVAGRAQLLGPAGLLRRCAGDTIRVMARPTQLYSTLLDESTHPDALRDALDRDRLFDLLWADSTDSPALRSLVRHEIDDLWAGDIPLFTGRPDSCDVSTADGTVLPGLVPQSSLHRVEAKIARLGEVDRLRQEWLITAALSTRAPGVSHRSGAACRDPITAVVPQPQRVLAAACWVADELMASAQSGGGRVNWLGLEVVDGRQWAVLPMGGGLPYGYCGPVLFLAQLASLTAAARYQEVVQDAIRPMPRLLDALARDPSALAAVGCGFNGLGGMCFALARLVTLFGHDRELLHSLESAVRLAHLLARDPVGTDRAVSFAEGEAGGLAAMLAVYAETGLPAAERLAWWYAERLAELVESRERRLGAELGFAHGPAGIGYALVRFAATLGEERFGAAGRAALAMETRASRPSRRDDVGWCGGLAGVLAATATAGAWRTATEELVARLAAGPPLLDLSLCHGELGVLDALVSAVAGGSARAAQAVHRRAGLVLGVLEQQRPTCGTPGGVSSPGLLSGLAGIGYGLLRLGFAEQVPSVLLLETLIEKENGAGE